ncbi:toprim domain-containing protein [Rhodoferax sp.]|uniref:toprim domain-containing protein n=1 Tax=Rhodoferax sp. TaxID=50421 RepID=UPI002613ECAE|nr:toprim domain-containing protein [Rhodoferax sp.]MDD2920634.1 toprim domain-containing protein [Rhodoferax sp.]
MRSLQIIENYLVARGCEIQKVKDHLVEFRLPGETSRTSGGRLSVARDGYLKMWHRYAEKGLAAGEPWHAAGGIRLGDKSTPALATHIDQLSAAKELSALTKVPKFSSKPQQRRWYDPEQVWRAADDLLQTSGLVPSRLHGRYRDGSDSKPVYKLLVSKDGVATAFSFRGDIALPAPWREGRQTSDGKKTMYVTGRDLGLDGDLAPPSSSRASPRSAPAELRTTDQDMNRDTCKSWMAGVTPPVDHLHLVKSNAVLDGAELRVYPPGHRFAGTILVPIFRPDLMGRPDTVELCGAQHLMPKVAFNTDKIMAKGSHTVGAFVPFPWPDSLMKAMGSEARAPIQAWLAVADRKKPLVICEGVATGLAIQQSGAGNTLCALSSNNVMAVAKWVKQTGMSDLFSGVVIATDHDIGRTEAGRLKSNAIPRALEAAKLTGFALAVPPANSQVGADARDLLGQGGPQSVRDFIASAVSAADVEKARVDIFVPVKESQLAAEPEVER